ncbi:family 76 glycosyl hydrolase [Apodospora peruviana]|uniref:Mannan endo-1,6-alpha-mannosidase n=1 Tax=Apodospora peruviana TaxID=516989 RepID=A0AAE0M079_9PEZI|nr:family 76 glycosyl hydrolase [Apodospora peruviana]
MIASLASIKAAAIAVPVLLAGRGIAAESTYKLDSHDAIIESAKTLAFDLMSLYNGNETGEIPGVLGYPPPSGPYYWWEGGALMSTMIDYWHLTGDDTYNDVVTQGIQHQVGPNNDFMTPNWTAAASNDDQCMWGLAALLAAEKGFPDPPKDQPQWLELAKAVWDDLASPDRHDDKCGGGLRWQIPLFNVGYDYKNSLPNACFFNLGARLAKLTGDKKYADASSETWDWLTGVGLLDTKTWAVYDGGHVDENCTDINKAQFSIVNAYLVQGAAYMYNFTKESDEWKQRITNLNDATLKTFFPNDIAFEAACEKSDHCTTDMLAFKGLAHRWLADTTQVASFTAEKLTPVLRKSTEAAVKQCTGGDSGRECGFFWSEGEFKETEAEGTVGQQMNVLAAVEGLLIADGVVGGGNGDGETDDGGSSGSSNEGGSTPTGTTTAPSGSPTSGAGRIGMEAVVVAVGLGAVGLLAL